MSEWIPVSERLPDIAADVLIYNANDCGEISIGYRATLRNHKGWTFCDSGGDVSVSCVSHWMPLPEPPK